MNKLLTETELRDQRGRGESYRCPHYPRIEGKADILKFEPISDLAGHCSGSRLRSLHPLNLRKIGFVRLRRVKLNHHKAGEPNIPRQIPSTTGSMLPSDLDPIGDTRSIELF